MVSMSYQTVETRKQPASFDLHVGRERSESLVEVIHLRQDADCCENHEDVGRRVRELVVASECELESNAKGLDGHDRDGADGGADGQVDQGVSLAVDGGNSVDHEDGKSHDSKGIQQETWLSWLVFRTRLNYTSVEGWGEWSIKRLKKKKASFGSSLVVRSYLAGWHSVESHRPSRFPRREGRAKR